MLHCVIRCLNEYPAEKPLRANERSFHVAAVQIHGRITLNSQPVKQV